MGLPQSGLLLQHPKGSYVFAQGQDGKLYPIQVDANGNLLVNVAVGGGGGATPWPIDEAAWAGGVSVFTPIGGVFDDDATALGDAQQGTVRSTATRDLHVNLRKNDGTELTTFPASQSGTWTVGLSAAQTLATVTTVGAVTSITNPVAVTGTFFQATQPVSGTVTANQGGAPWSNNITQVNGTTLLAGTGAQAAGSPRVTVAVDSATVAGSASLPAGTNLVGKVGIDQTTPGTTNGVSVGATTTSLFTTQKTLATVATGNGTVMAAANAARKGFTICNLDAAITVYWGDTAVVSGAAAVANGGTPITAGAADGMVGLGVYTGPINVIAASGTPLVNFKEW